jgi:hypothetical protein
MSAETKTSLIYRLRTTPLRDLLRGNVSGRFDVNGRITAASLPAPAADLIRSVVRHTRLWKSEKMAVAEELIAHFLDGLEAGQPAAELTASFGDEMKTAKLIRRAKKRNRPLVWHAMKWMRRGMAALIVFYLGSAVYFFTGRATVSVDYVAEMNRKLDGIPVADRGWPLYAPVVRKFERLDATERDWSDFFDARPGSKQWDKLVTWLRDNAADVEAVRAAAAKPTMGFVLGNGGSMRDLLTDQKSPAVMQQLVTVILPHLSELRTIAEVLGADARQAAQQRDAARALHDMLAMVRISRQMHDDPGRFLVSDLVGVGIRALAMDEMNHLLADTSELFSDAELTQLAHELSRVRMTSDMISYEYERIVLYDLLQRMYTDDGHGNGRLSRDAINIVREYQTRLKYDPTKKEEPSAVGMAALGPAFMLVSASRQELRTQFDELINLAQSQLSKPIREVDMNEYERRFDSDRAGIMGTIRNWPVAMLAPGINRVQVSAERNLGQQDGVLIGIALELHHRKTGSYPATLAELSPGLLPSVPVDRITGEPLKYKLVNGKPLAYSVGANRIDDGGEVWRDRDGQPWPVGAAEWGSHVGADAQRADWLLYPVPAADPDR